MASLGDNEENEEDATLPSHNPGDNLTVKPVSDKAVDKSTEENKEKKEEDKDKDKDKNIWQTGDKCLYYYKKTSTWCEGQVIEVFTDEEGKWLRICINNKEQNLVAEKLIKYDQAGPLSLIKLKDQPSDNNDNDDDKKEEVGRIGNLISKLSLDSKTNHKSALFYHTDCLKHKPGDGSSHVERPERCGTSYQMLTNYGLLKKLIVIKPREATLKELKGTHSDQHVNKVISNANKSGWYDGDTFYNKHSSHAAKLAAGAIIDLMAGILQKKYDNGFALVRPPGHHCEHDKGMLAI